MVGPYKLIGMSECTIISIDFSEVNVTWTDQKWLYLSFTDIDKFFLPQF